MGFLVLCAVVALLCVYRFASTTSIDNETQSSSIKTLWVSSRNHRPCDSRARNCPSALDHLLWLDNNSTKFVQLNDPKKPIEHPFSIWSPGSQREVHFQIRASMDKYDFHQRPIMLSLPGLIPMASKRGFVEVLINRYGADAAPVPETWLSEVKSNGLTDMSVHEKRNSLLEDVATSKYRVVKRRGHKQKGIQIVAPGESLYSVLRGYTNVIMVQNEVENQLRDSHNRRLAGRLYLKVVCESETSVRGFALLDSPFYVSNDESSFVASGYNSESHRSKLSSSIFFRKDIEEFERALKPPVVKVLDAMAAEGACALEFDLPSRSSSSDSSSSHQPPRFKHRKDLHARADFAELFGLDYVPFRKADGSLEIKLLELNRFPDMTLQAKHQFKNSLKVCALAFVSGVDGVCAPRRVVSLP